MFNVADLFNLKVDIIFYDTTTASFHIDQEDDPEVNEAAWFMSLFNPEMRLKGLKPENVFKQFKPEDRLKGLDLETIEAYLEKTKNQLKESNLL